MNVDERNRFYLSGEVDRDDCWPKVKDYESQSYQFRWEFGLDELPEEPGIITIRGARQTGKSTWLELKLLMTIEKYGGGSAFFLNGDFINTTDEFEDALLKLESSFKKNVKVKRIFIDEITQIKSWEKVLKRLIDSGHFKDVLFITTGSNASDLRRGGEKLPGRKGKLKRSEYIFLPISYREFQYQTKGELGMFETDRLWAYILSGGSPLAVKGLDYHEKLDDTFISLISDWVLGDIASSGRSRILFLNLLRKLYQSATSQISYTKLAQDAGLANNTAALDYVEKLADLLCIEPMMCWDANKDIALSKKPSKFQFINLAFAMAFHPATPRYIHELRDMEGKDRASLHEWIVAQELWRRIHLKNQTKLTPNFDSSLMYWASKDNEIDFVGPDRDMYEVKSGNASPKDYYWFTKVFPKKKLTIISNSEFETTNLQSVTLEKFLWGAETELYYDEDHERVRL